MSNNSTFKLTVTHYKILETVFVLNKDSYFPLSSGINKILSGVDDKETEPFKELPTYGTLISLTNKKITRIVNILMRHNFLTQKYDDRDNSYYIAITNLGVSYLNDYLAKRKKPYPKKATNIKPTIVKIDN